MKITKTRTVKTPSRANPSDAGIDFYVPEFNEQFIKDLISKNPQKLFSGAVEDIKLSPHERILIPSGIHVNFKEEAKKTRAVFGTADVGLALNVHNKSGVASKKGLDRLAETVDENYTGEVHISLVNTSNETITISPNEKIIQCILEPIFTTHIEEVASLTELYPEQTDRGTGGFGSTNNK